MKNLIIMIGNIGSGKSTFANKYQQKGYIVISRDQLRYGIGNGNYIFNLKYEPTIWKTELYLFRKFADLGVNILVDEVGLTKSMRRRYIPYAKKKGYKVTAIELPRFCMGESVTRRMINPHGQYNYKLWCKVWNKFEGIYEVVDKKREGIDKHVKIKKEEVS